MKDESLIHFNNPMKYNNFIEELDIYNGWQIESGLMNDRGEKIRNKSYSVKLRKLFNDKKMFRKSVSISEIVTWLDSFVHIDRILTLLRINFDTEILNEIEISFEYIIEMSKKSRVDCIIKYKNRYCLIEFRTVNKFERMKAAYDKKRIELMIYKDMMENYMPIDSKIIVLPFIGLYEFEEGKLIEKHRINNIKQAQFASEYIDKYLVSPQIFPKAI